jgi:hypothetical protein
MVKIGASVREISQQIAREVELASEPEIRTESA